MRLQPFSHQVTGHAFLLTTEDQMTICKVMEPNELNFYLNMDRDFQPFTPEFRGVVDVTVCSESEGKYEFEADFKDNRGSCVKMRSGCTGTNKRRNDSDHGDHVRRKKHSLTPAVKYRGLDPSKYNEDPEFQSNQYTRDAKYEPFISDVGRNPWVQRVQRIARHKINKGNTFPYILLENLGGMFEKPCILDLKMGTQIHGWDCKESKLRNHLAKNKVTTTSTIGLRLTGLQLYRNGAYICRDKFYGRGLSNAGLKEVFRLFFSDGKNLRLNILDKVIEKVKRVKSVVSRLQHYRLYGSSMVIFYEGDETECSETNGRLSELGSDAAEDDIIDHNNDMVNERTETDVRVVDFAHSSLTPPSDRGVVSDGPDGGFILGLTNCLKMLREIKEEGL